MKKYNTIIFMAAALLTLAGCSQETLPGTDEAGKEAMIFTAISTQKAETRATVDGDWQGVGTVAVKIGDEVKEYIVTASEDNTTATLSNSTSSFYWNSKTETVTAWSPYSNGQTALPAAKVKADQSTEENYQASDLIAAENQNVTYGNAKLEFAHRTAHISATITLGSNITDVEKAAAKVRLTGLSSADGNPTDIIPFTTYNTDGTISIKALLAPQTIADDAPFIVTDLGYGVIFTYTPTDKNLEANHHYQYSITVNREANVIDLSSVSGDKLTVRGKVTLKGDGTEKDLQVFVQPGSEVTLDGVNLKPTTGTAIACNGTATIVLKGTNTLETTDKTSALSINGEGTLTIKEGEAEAKLTAKGGIEGKGNKANITIESGEISANGRIGGCAGIGSKWSSSCGNITISGGTVTASGDAYAAGIGSGHSSGSRCGIITISGGTVKANGGYGSAAIGSGYAGSTCSDIIISGGNITAIGDVAAACIGSGSYGGKCGNITISGNETVITTRDDATNLIGSGGANGSCGTVTVKAGVTVNGTKYTEDQTGEIKSTT